jgi:hypothetical protein
LEGFELSVVGNVPLGQPRNLDEVCHQQAQKVL